MKESLRKERTKRKTGMFAKPETKSSVRTSQKNMS